MSVWIHQNRRQSNEQTHKNLAIFLFICILFSHSATATDIHNTDDYIIHLTDGSYITVELTVQQSRALSMVTGSKSYIYHDSNGTEQWRAVLTGTFSYNGSKATCTVSTCDVSITNTAWYVVSKTATKSENTARCNLTMGRKNLGITVEQQSFSIKLTCDANGNLS